MGWLIVGLLIGYAIGHARASHRWAGIALAANKLRTRSSAAARLAEKSEAMLPELRKAAEAGVMTADQLAALVNTVADWTFIAHDMIDDQVVLLREVADGRT